MTCELTLTGQLVVGGGSCGCSSSSSATKVQPLGLSCSTAAYGSIGSTDCAVSISSPDEFVPLPVGGPSVVSLLYVKTDRQMELRWGGEVAVINGDTVLGGITFAGGETFDFVITKSGTGIAVNTTFQAGVFTLSQVVDILNANAITAGAGYMPASLNEAGTAIILTGSGKSVEDLLFIGATQPLIGFSSNTEAAGVDPTMVSINGAFLSQFDPGISDVEIKGSGNATILAAGAA